MGSFADHIILPVTFVLKQLIVLVPFFIMCLFLLKKLELKKFVFNDKKIFLLFTCILPIALMVLTSLILGAKIRTMWMTPFYLFIGVLFIEIFKNKINFKNLKNFYAIFYFFFLLSPMVYFTVSVSNDFKKN